MSTSGLSLDASSIERQPSQEINDQAAMFEKFSAVHISETGGENFVGKSSLLSHPIFFLLKLIRCRFWIVRLFPARPTAYKQVDWKR